MTWKEFFLSLKACRLGKCYLAIACASVTSGGLVSASAVSLLALYLCCMKSRIVLAVSRLKENF